MKVYNYVVAILGLMVLLDFAGLYIPGEQGIATLFGFTRDTTTNIMTFDPSLSAIASYLFSNVESLGIGVLIGLAAAGIAIGTFAKGNLENFIILPIITTTLILFITALKRVVDIGLSGGSMPGWISYVVAFVGVVLVGGLIVSLWEHFRGTD